MNKILLGMALFASVANAQQFVAVIDAKFTVKESDQTPPPNGCVGKELTREELDTMIANGDDVTKACVGTIEDFSFLLTGYLTSTKTYQIGI